jgi:hypothetical protein
MTPQAHAGFRKIGGDLLAAENTIVAIGAGQHALAAFDRQRPLL